MAKTGAKGKKRVANRKAGGTTPKRSKKAIAVCALVVVVLVIVVTTVVCCASSQNGDGSQPLVDELKSVGAANTPSEWYDTLDDEQKAAVDIAFDSSVADDGYAGTKDEWLSSQVRARQDANGNLVVMLPDGGSFIAPIGQGASGSSGSGSSSSEPPANGTVNSATDTTPSPSAGTDSSIGSMLTVDTVQAKAGDADVMVAVRVERNVGILGMTLSVSYDDQALTLTKADSGEAFNGVLSMSRSKNLASGCVFTWDGLSISPDQVLDGPILILYFDVAKDAPAGIHSIAVRCGEDSVFDNDLNEVGIAVQDGSIVVANG